MSINIENREQSAQFINALRALMDFVEDMLPHINEQKYLEMCDMLKIVHNGDRPPIDYFVDNLTHAIRNTQVYRDHERRVRMPIKTPGEQLTDAEKMKNNKYCVCPKCDRLVLKTGLKIHQTTDVCKRTHESKKLSKSTGEVDTSKQCEFIHRVRGWAIDQNKSQYFVN